MEGEKGRRPKVSVDRDGGGRPVPLQKDGQFHGGRRGESIVGQWWEVVTWCRGCEGWRLRARSRGAGQGEVGGQQNLVLYLP